MTTIFVDTNLLLHAKPLAQIIWEERHDPPVTIVITRTNIKELDKHKDQHPKKHLRERARKALQAIEAATSIPTIRKDTKLVVDNRTPRVNLDEHELDAASADDMLVAGVLVRRAEHPDEVIILYTHDVGPRLTAQRLGIVARPIPDEDRLPPQKDEVEKENERLKKELHEFKTAAPRLHVTINDSADRVETSTMGRIPEALTEETIVAATKSARANLPVFSRGTGPEPESVITRVNRRLVIDFDKHLDVNADAIPASEYDRYDRLCERYEADYRKYLLDRHEAQLIRSRTVALQVVLENVGGQPAEDVNIELTFPPNISVTTDPPRLPGPQPAAPTTPRTQHQLMHDTVQAAVRFDSYLPPYHALPDINPAKRGPWIDGTAISWWMRALKHGFVKDLDTVYVTLGASVNPFTVAYTLHAANARSPFRGKVLIKPSIAQK
jgi:hypothetical protein